MWDCRPGKSEGTKLTNSLFLRSRPAERSQTRRRHKIKGCVSKNSSIDRWIFRADASGHFSLFKIHPSPIHHPIHQASARHPHPSIDNQTSLDPHPSQTITKVKAFFHRHHLLLFSTFSFRHRHTWVVGGMPQQLPQRDEGAYHMTRAEHEKKVVAKRYDPTLHQR